MRHLLRTSAASALVAGIVALVVAPAAAHIEPDVAAIPAGGKATVVFTVEHGCDESPTTKLEIEVPASITDAAAVKKAGWTGATKGKVVTFAGGSQPAHIETTFSLTFTTPKTEGATLVFPIIQTCKAGETDWISTSEADEHPAPKVTVGPAGATPTTAPADDDDDEEAAATTTTSAVADDQLPSTDDGSDSNTVVVLAGVGSALFVLVGGTIASIRMKKSN